MEANSINEDSTEKPVEFKEEQNISVLNIKQLLNIFQNVPAATAIFEGPEHKYILANRAYETITNRKAADLLGKSSREVFPELIGTGLFEIFDKVFETGEPFTAPEYAIMLDLKNEGILRQGYFNFSVDPLKNDSGEIHAIIVISYDVTEQVEAKKKVEDSEKQLAFDLNNAKKLQAISTQLIHEENIDLLYEQLVDSAIALMRSDMGSIQLYHPERKQLELLTHKGFHPESAAHWKWISTDSKSVCSAALRNGDRFIASDLEKDELTIETKKLHYYQLSGIRAVQSTPLISRNGDLVGMISTHWGEPHQPSERELQLFDVLARQAADLIERKKSEEKIKESEHRFHELIYSSPAMMAIFKGEDMIIEIANDAIITSWGQPKDIIGKSIFLVLPEVIEQGFDKLLLNVYKTGEPFQAYETPVTLLKNSINETIYYNFVYQAHRNLYGEIVGVAVLANEVTPQAILNKKIKASEQRFHALFMQSPFAFSIMIGKDMKVTLANDLMKEFWGKGENVEGKTILEILPELSNQPFPAMIESVYTTGVPVYANEMLAKLNRNGILEDKYFDIVYEPHLEADDTISGVITISHEVTQQVLSRKNIEESETLFKLALFLTAKTVFKQDAQLKYTWIYNTHPSFQMKDLIGKTDSDLFNNDAAILLNTIKQTVFSTGNTFIGDIQIEIDGKPYDFAMKVEATKDSDGKINGIIAVTDDISERKQAEIEIKEKEQGKAFLLKLSDTLRPLDNPADIEEAVTKITRDFMDADWCLYAIIEENNLIIKRDAVRDGLPSVAGEYQISDFTLFKAILDAGRPFVVDDVHTTDILDKELKQLCIQLQNISFINVPVIKNGKPVGLLSIVQSKPRKWTDTEEQLSIEIAERIWAAVERAKTEQALRISEKKYRNLFTSIDQGFMLCELVRNQEGKGIDYNLLEVNPSYEKLTGVSWEMRKGKTILQAFPTLDKWWIETYTAVVDNQCPVVFEKYFEGNHRCYEVNAYPVEKDKFAVLFSDITKRKQAEEKIKESEQEIRKIKEQLELSIEAGKIGIWHWDIKNDILTWSKEQKVIYGFSDTETITNATQFNDLIFPEDLKCIQDDQSAGNKLEHEHDFRIIRKNDGEIRWLKSRARNVVNEQGELQFISGVNIDITEQVLALNKIQENEERFRNLAETLPQMVWVMNAQGKIEYVSKNWKEYSGIDDVQEAWNSMMHPDDRERLTLYWKQLFAEKKGFQHEVRLKNKEGNYRWFYSIGRAVLDADEKVSKWVGSLTDIQEQKEVEEKLMEAKVSAENAAKSRQQFLSNMSHEIRTPLNSIIGFANVLFKTELGEKQKEFVHAIKTSGKSLNLLINDILDLAKVDEGKMTFEMQPFEMHKSITSALHTFDLHIKEKNLEFVEEYDNKIPNVLLGDSLRLNQIILNLISNAVKFTEEGEIKISIRLLNEDEENVKIEFVVTDTGIGIPANKINTIFSVFEQAEISTFNSYGGTGLGLAIVKQLIEGLGGSISVKSKLGEGSIFSFIMPFGKTNVKLESEIEIVKPDPDIKKLRVLVAEDAEFNQLLIKFILKDMGFESEIVDNGKLAIEKMQTNTYDIILMDLRMPEMNGFEATEYIRKTLKSQIPIIALTANVTSADVSKCQESGMDDYISKPFTENLLYSKIVELVKKGKLIDNQI